MWLSRAKWLPGKLQACRTNGNVDTANLNVSRPLHDPPPPARLVGDSMRTRMAMEVEHAKLEADAKAADVLISGQFASG